MSTTAENKDDKAPASEETSSPMPEQQASAQAGAPSSADTSDDVDDLDFSIFDKVIPGETVEDTPVKQAESPKAVETQQPAVVPPTPATPTAPEPVVEPASQEPQPAVQSQPAPSSAQPEQPAPQQQPAATPSPQTTPQAETTPDEDGFTKLDKAIQASRDTVIEAVATSSYQLSQEELEGIQVEPEKVLPKLMARVHVNAVQGVLRHVAQQMPAMVHGLIHAQSEHKAREDEFFKAWPQLDRTKHGQDIVRAGQVFRQLNPQATLQDFIKQVGAQVVIAHGLHLQAPAQAAQPQQQRTVQQQAASTPAPFVPAGVGRTSAPVTIPTENNPWSELVEVMNE